MEQVELFKLSDDFNRIPEWHPLFDPEVMDVLANFGAMGWRAEIERRNFELKYKSHQRGGDMNEYDKCYKCDYPVSEFTWVKHFGNAWFFGCPKCHLPTKGGDK